MTNAIETAAAQIIALARKHSRNGAAMQSSALLSLEDHNLEHLRTLTSHILGVSMVRDYLDEWIQTDADGKTLQDRLGEVRQVYRGLRRLYLEHGCTADDLTRLRASYWRDLNRAAHLWMPFRSVYVYKIAPVTAIGPDMSNTCTINAGDIRVSHR